MTVTVHSEMLTQRGAAGVMMVVTSYNTLPSLQYADSQTKVIIFAHIHFECLLRLFFQYVLCLIL